MATLLAKPGATLLDTESQRAPHGGTSSSLLEAGT